MTALELSVLTAIFGHRISALLKDGYKITQSTDLYYYKFLRLRHDTNGKEIVFHLYPSKNRMVQKTDGKVVYDGKISG